MTTSEIIQEIEEKLNDLYRIADLYVPLSAQGRFSDYDNAKEGILDFMNEYTLLLEGYDTIEEEKQEAEKSLKYIREDLEDIISDVEGIDESTYEEGTVIPGVVESDIQGIYSKLIKIRDGERLYPVKKTVKRKKK